jgi:curved DNA-binding protein CbpA
VSAELGGPYELAGVKPGVSIAELKAAFRDLVKVWHPDRFGQVERLQNKAQKALKELNEGYDQLISGKRPRPQPTRKRTEEEFKPETGAQVETPQTVVAPMPAMSTVTALVHPAFGLLAKSDYPFKTRSYSSSRQPKGYCSISHPAYRSARRVDSEESLRHRTSGVAKKGRRSLKNNYSPGLRISAPQTETASVSPATALSGA